MQLICFALPLLGFLVVLFTAKSSILSPIDVVVFLCYFLFVAGYGLYVYKYKGMANSSQSSSSATIDQEDMASVVPETPEQDETDSASSDADGDDQINEAGADYNPPNIEVVASASHSMSSAAFFLAEGSLSWWAIGASIIASNISAEHFIGMSGNGFSIGLSISVYEWLAVIAMIVTAVFFVPVYLKYNIHTMPQFLQRRFSPFVSVSMAVIWLLLYICINLTSILYLGALAVSSVTAYPLYFCMAFLAVSAFMVTIGGMKVIGYTDAVQVCVLVLGGLATTYVAVLLVSERLDPQNPGFVNGLLIMSNRSADHFHLILEPDNPHYIELPGASILLALNIGNLAYFACNQYIVQRCLGADLKTARYGMLFAACLKLFIPVLVVLPGIACYTLWRDGMFQEEMLAFDAATNTSSVNQDRAYPVLLNLLPTGLKGLAFAALSAAIISSLASKANSIATIFTLDLYLKARPATTQQSQVIVGRLVVFCALLFATLVSPFLGIEKSGGYQFVQQMTGFLTPGILVAFLGGLFWRRANVAGAVFALLGGFVISAIMTFAVPALFDLQPLATYGISALDADGTYSFPFLNLMMFVFVVCFIGMLLCGYCDSSANPHPRALHTDRSMFRTTTPFLVISSVLCVIVFLLYVFLW